ncbi:MAG: ABC transporter permease [Planctomycetaceae bacterium]|nr:ABC transporter permease [Planctomycetaceae bacterium]
MTSAATNALDVDTLPGDLSDRPSHSADAPGAALPHPESTAVTIIEPRPGWRPVNLAELWRYRELVYFLTWRDVKVRYKQTVMGAAWAVIQPLLTSLVFVVLFGVMGRMNADTTVPYLAFVFAGQMAWQFFQSAVVQSGQSLVSSANLISKVYFPRLIVPMASVGAGLVDFMMSLGVMATILAAYLLAPPLQVLLLPLMLIGVVTTALGVGSLLAALTVAYRDFRYVVPFLVQMWMLTTPVGYPFSRIEGLFNKAGLPDWWFGVYFFLNPMAGYVEGFRWCLLGTPLHFGMLALSACSSVLLLVIGAMYFRRVERRFADIV